MKAGSFSAVMLGVLLVFAILSGRAAAAEEGSSMMTDDEMRQMMQQRQMGYGGGMGMMGGGMMGMHGMGPGMMGMGGMGMMGGMMGMGPIHMLDLTDAQRTKINKIQDGVRKQHWDTMGKMMDEHAKLRDLYAAEEWDAKKIGAVYDRIFKFKRGMIEASVDTHNRVRAVLTKEQKEQLKQMQRGMWGRGRRGPMNMPHGMMGQ